MYCASRAAASTSPSWRLPSMPSTLTRRRRSSFAVMSSDTTLLDQFPCVVADFGDAQRIRRQAHMVAGGHGVDAGRTDEAFRRLDLVAQLQAVGAAGSPHRR